MTLRVLLYDDVTQETLGAAGALTDPLAKDTSVIHQLGKFKPGIRTTKALTVNGAGNNIIHTPAAGKKVRVYWLGLSTSQDNTAETVVVLKFGAAGDARYRWCMGNPGAFSHWEPIEGAVDEALIVSLSTGQNVEVNVTLEEI